MVIGAPRPHGAVTLHGQAVVLPGSDCHHSREPCDLGGSRNAIARGIRRERSVAELTIEVVAPGPDGAIRLEGEAVETPRGDCRHASHTAHLYRCRATQW